MAPTNSSNHRTKTRKISKSYVNKKSDSSSNNLQYTVKLTKQAYEKREQTCSYKDYLALITLASFNVHEIKHIQVKFSFAFINTHFVKLLQKDKYKTNPQIEMELLKRWNKLPLEERNKYENEAIDDDIFHQIAYTRLDNDGTVGDRSLSTQGSSIGKELEVQWNELPDAEKVVHKRVVTNRDIETTRLF